jgi:hypothetical protein
MDPAARGETDVSRGTDRPVGIQQRDYGRFPLFIIRHDGIKKTLLDSADVFLQPQLACVPSAEIHPVAYE